ncbi:MAG TPA: MotA/TolQ/ExbB proton channel family protein [Verrucomicrobiae bacterium]|nr:MotA/TolQ/ExbB proton channel family protein [Verrucomicrobiae bacterium]
MHHLFTPILADGALRFAFEKATIEGKITIGTLLVVSIFSWTTIITKARQLGIARKMAKKFYASYRQSRDPLDIANRKEEYPGAPGYEVYATGVDELAYQLKNNPVDVRSVVKSHSSALPSAAQEMDTDIFSRGAPTKISASSFASVKGALEREVSAQALALEKGMIVLSTAVAGGPFIGLLGTVWGVMETFSGIAKAQAASLTAMAPGVAGALIATVTGLFVAIPSMFAYNYMVTTIRAITQELDGFASELATQMEHRYVDNRPLADEIRDALTPLLRDISARNGGETDPMLRE